MNQRGILVIIKAIVIDIAPNPEGRCGILFRLRAGLCKHVEDSGIVVGDIAVSIHITVQGISAAVYIM